MRAFVHKRKGQNEYFFCKVSRFKIYKHESKLFKEIIMKDFLTNEEVEREIVAYGATYQKGDLL